jgi:long-chain acyl-CoA synthetase
MMYSAELKEKIADARALHAHALVPLPVRNLRELLVIRRVAEDPFLTYADANGVQVRLSYHAFSRKVLGAAHYLRAQKLSAGDRIATAAVNHWQTVVHYFAAWTLGLVVVPLNLGEDDARLLYIMQNAQVKHLFVQQPHAERIQGILKQDAQLNRSGVTVFGDDMDYARDTDLVPSPTSHITPESDALIVYTSGTTGNPKGVVLSHRNLLEDARSIADWHRINDRTRMMCVLPIHHVNGTVVTLVTPFYAGASVVLNQKFSVHRFFQTIADENVHIVSVVPTLLQYLSHEYENKDFVYPGSLRHVICGAGPLTVETARRFEERFDIRVIHGYGLSETTCYSCFLPLDLSGKEHRYWMQEYGFPSIGVPVPANEMAIHDENGNPLGENERGEIVIRGLNVMKEYFHNEEANEKAFTHRWFRSGDEGFFINDETGRSFFFITGRIKELIIRGGVNLAPLEIDEVINRAPGVKSGIAVGFANDWYGEEVGAYVVLQEGAPQDAGAILAFCAEHLPPAKMPKVVVFGTFIPVTSTGKYQRMKVAPLFAAWKSEQFR